MRRLGAVSILLFLFIAGAKFEKPIIQVPEHFPEAIYQTDLNSITSAQIELGRMLFYDPILSRDSTISCASCHSPYNAFAHTDHALSHGIDDHIGTRNAPALFNLAWQQLFMWDGAINHIDNQPLAPITDSSEMDESLENVLRKVQRKQQYSPEFEVAFGSQEVRSKTLMKALAAFQLSLVSANSRFDSMSRGEVRYNEMEEKGYLLFQRHCQSCHTAPLFTSPGYKNNGLKMDSELKDIGRAKISNLPADSFLFKIPSLRNLKYSYPYMHDGRFQRLRGVLDHYGRLSGSEDHLSEELSGGLTLSSNEKTELLAFLSTLNDSAFIRNKKHHFPPKLLPGSE